MIPGRYNRWPRIVVTILASLAILIAPLFISPLTAAPNDAYSHRIWRPDDGLQSPAVRAIIQSRSGYLLLGTDDGLCRFDGMQFRDIERKTSTDKVARWMVALTETRDGSLWYSSVNGGISRSLNGETIRYTTNNGLPGDYVLCVFEDSQKNLWAGTASGLARFDGNKFISYTNNPGLPVEAVRSIVEDPNGTLWVGLATGLSFYRNGTFSLLPDDKLVHPSVMSLLVTRDGALWIGTAGGVTRLLKGEPTHFTMNDGLVHDTIRSICQTREGEIFVATHGGLQKLVNGRFETPTLRHTVEDFEGITFSYSLFEDQENNLWVGTSLGLNRLQRVKIDSMAKEEGLPHNLATLVFEEKPGTIWIGTYGGGLSQLSDGKVETFTKENSGLVSDYILALAKDREGTFWIGTDGNGLLRWQNGQFEQFLQENISANIVRVIFQDSLTNLWIGHNAGVSRLRDGAFIVEPNLPRSAIKAIAQDKHTNIWFAARSGLTRWWDGNMKTYKESDGLCVERVNAIYADSDGVLWVGTEAGLNRMEELGVFTSFKTLDGPFREHILHIVEDNAGRLWLSTRNGIVVANKQELNAFTKGKVSVVNFSAYGKQQGMRRAQCNGIGQPAGWKASDGRIWFPTLHGVVFFDPEDMQSNRLPPKAQIEQVFIDGKPASPSQPITLKPGTVTLEFQYTGLSFQAPEKVRFKYRLEGVDSKWEDAGTRRFARYLHLAPGDYVFRVKACNNDGIWDEVGTSLAFTKEPHFYQTWVFYSFCLLAAVGGVFGVLQYRTASHQRREKELAALVEQRTAKLQEMIKSMEGFNYSIAHDLRAPIRAIRGFTEALVEDYRPNLDATGCEYAERIQLAVERMDQLIQDLLIYGQLTHKEIPLECVNTETVLNRVLENFAPEIQAKKAIVNVRKPLPEFSANSTILHQIFSNLLSNALKFIKADVPPAIEIWAENGNHDSVIRVYVRDNGIGIKKEHQERIFRIFERLHPGDIYPGTGIGLAIVQRGAERMGGKVGVESTPGQGSCFWVEFTRCTQS